MTLGAACHLVELELARWPLLVIQQAILAEPVRGQDGQHQPGGEGVGQEDGELLEERGPRWEDQQAQAPGGFLSLCLCLVVRFDRRLLHEVSPPIILQFLT